MSVITRFVAGASGEVSGSLGPPLLETMENTAGSGTVTGPFPVFSTFGSAHTTSMVAVEVSSASGGTLGAVAVAVLVTPGQSDGNDCAITFTVSVFPAPSAGSLQVSTPPLIAQFGQLEKAIVQPAGSSMAGRLSVSVAFAGALPVFCVSMLNCNGGVAPSVIIGPSPVFVTSRSAQFTWINAVADSFSSPLAVSGKSLLPAVTLAAL